MQSLKLSAESSCLDEVPNPRYLRHMQVTVQIPDELAKILGAEGDLSRRVVEALLVEEYRSGRLTKPQLRTALNIETSHELDGFLKRHHVWIDYDEHESALEQSGLERLGL